MPRIDPVEDSGRTINNAVRTRLASHQCQVGPVHAAALLRRIEIGGGGASKLSVDLVIGFVGAAQAGSGRAGRRQPLA
jgi:hypothetical protein